MSHLKVTAACFFVKARKRMEQEQLCYSGSLLLEIEHNRFSSFQTFIGKTATNFIIWFLALMGSFSLYPLPVLIQWKILAASDQTDGMKLKPQR